MSRLSRLCCTALAATALLAGCGTGTVAGVAEPSAHGDTANLSAQLASMSETVKYNAVAKKSVHITLSSSTDGKVAMSGEGDYAFRSDGIDMDVKMSGLGGIAGGEPGATAGMGTEMITLNDITYMKGLPTSNGKPWIKIDPNGTDPLSKMLGPMLRSSQQFSDPTKLLTLAKQAGTINKISDDQIDGEAATHYSITIDTQKMLAQMPGSDMKKLAQAGASALPKTYPMDVWINSDKLPVRFTMAEPLPGSTKTTMRTDFTDWGRPVTIAAPPANQVGTLH
ncbi:MAG: hypothetical protein ACRDRN_19790 [Sciscionella sp.]